MAKDQRTHIVDGNFGSNSLTPKHLSRQEFAKRLYRLMLKKSWTQAELARQSGLLRDSISNYIRGNILPTAQNLEKLAKALGVKSTELLPNVIETAIDTDQPSMEVRASASDPGRSWIRLNRLVRTATVGKIIAILEDDDAAH